MHFKHRLQYVLIWTSLKFFSSGNGLKVIQKAAFVTDTVENNVVVHCKNLFLNQCKINMFKLKNNVEKREKAAYWYFLLFPYYFKKCPFTWLLKPGFLRKGLTGYDLTLSQTTKFQREFADNNFKLHENGITFSIGRKPCGKRRNCSS